MTTFRTHARTHFADAFAAANDEILEGFRLTLETLSDLDEEDTLAAVAELQDKLERRRAAHPLD